VTTLDALFTALEQTPDDWVARAALADCYEEAGLEATAACLRWMIAQRLRPSRRLAGGAFWFDGSHDHVVHTDRDAYLPRALFDALRRGRVAFVPEHVRFYESPREAEEDLFAAFAAAGEGMPK
jgi:hypothetical protein